MFNPSIHLLNKEIREKNFKNALSMVTFFLFLPALGIIFWLFIQMFRRLKTKRGK